VLQNYFIWFFASTYCEINLQFKFKWVILAISCVFFYYSTTVYVKQIDRFHFLYGWKLSDNQFGCSLWWATKKSTRWHIILYKLVLIYIMIQIIMLNVRDISRPHKQWMNFRSVYFYLRKDLRIIFLLNQMIYWQKKVTLILSGQIM